VSRRRRTRRARNRVVDTRDEAVRAQLEAAGITQDEVAMSAVIFGASQAYRESHPEVTDASAFAIILSTAVFNRPEAFGRESVLKIAASAINRAFDMQEIITAESGGSMVGEVEA
jgi:hypothetical protein